MNISFFKTPEHRVFHYEPRYWDERKEHREQVKNEALREKAMREGKEWKDEAYKPGMYISGSNAKTYVGVTIMPRAGVEFFNRLRLTTDYKWNIQGIYNYWDLGIGFVVGGGKKKTIKCK